MKTIDTDLFGEPIKTKYEVEVTPVSVLDIGPQKVRERGGHDAKSSRQEYSPFPAEVASLCFEFFMRDASNVFDPFAGWGERGAAARAHGRKYTGFDLSPDAIKEAERKGIANTLANSLFDPIPSHDGLVTCPPYWNLEKYAGEGIDKAKTWEGFQYDYSAILSRCWDKAAEGSVYCIMVGEWRSNHKYYDLEGVTRRIMHDLGAEMVDQITVSRKNVSKIKIMLPQAKRLGYTVRVHESLLVFRKPAIFEANQPDSNS
jgi:DNA modification methylase